MGLTQSIHDINIINAMSGTDDTIPLSSNQNITNTINTMQQKYNMQIHQNQKTNNLSSRNSNRYLYKFSSIMLRQNQKSKKIEKEKKENKAKEEESKEKFTILKNKNTEKEDSNLIENTLITHFFMKILNKQAREAVIQEMSLVEVKKNKFIFEQGNIGNYFYILKKGIAQLTINNKVVRVIKIGESFGELALLHDAPRSGTVVTVTDCLLWTLERRNFRKIIEHITKINYEENLRFIDSIPILSHIEQYQKTILSSSLFKEEFQPNTIIVKKGELATCLYIIKEGEVECVDDDGNVIRTLKSGDNFGERSILVDTKRTLDVITKTKCICYSISISTLKSMLSDKYRSFLYLNFMKSAFKNSKFFNKFSGDLLNNIFQHFEAVNLGKDYVAFPIGHVKSSTMVIMIDGNLINSKNGEIIASRGDILFEKELLSLSKEKTTYALFPNPDALFIEADTKKIMYELQCASFNEIMNKCEIIESLSKISLFKNLPQNKLSEISTMIHIEKFNPGQKIISEGDKAGKFYIVKNGEVNISVRGQYLRTLNSKEYFGERALLTKELRTATAISKGKTELYSLYKEDFLRTIELNMKNFLMNRLYLQDDTIELKDLYFIKELGSGNYGSVSLVYCEKNNYMYAIKAISRKHINYEHLHHNLDLEKGILLKVDHPFIVKLVKCLKDENNIYFLMEYLKGKELFDVIRDIGLLNKSQTLFYSASMLTAINYLHERKFIYRDLKPENIIVIHNGFIKLIDFGTAKKITDRTSTIIGTPHYMAPEVILGEGYSFQVDLWSIGICMFEFICGGVPFGETADDPMEIYISIINDKITFPSFCKDKEFKNLIKLMLEKNPLNRITTIDSIKKHIWFNGFNWEELISLNMNPPYLPKIKPLPSINIPNNKNNNNNEENSDSDINMFISNINKGNNSVATVKYSDYVKVHVKEWEPEKEIVITEDEKIQFDKWYEDF